MPPLTCTLVERLETMSDPRRRCENLKPPLVDLLILGFCGVRGGCEEFVESAAGAKVHEGCFRSVLEVWHGISAHATFNRVFAMRNPTTRQEVVLPWLLERRGLAGDWIHLDGKPLRQTGRPIPQLKALPMGRAWAGQTGLTLGQVAVDAKSNEITALPQLWELLDLRDKIVTTDAMGCPEDIAKTRVAGGGDYSLAVKDNQPPWPAELQAAFATAATPPARSPRLSTTEDHGHGREENSARCRCCPRAAGQGLEFL